MEEKIKCSLEEHKDKIAIKYCPECRINMCNKCENYHSSPLFKNHHPYDINKPEEIFTGFCKENNHSNKLEYFCKNHNQLCCTICLCKLTEKGKGQHKDCDVCCIENISEQKKNKLKENIKSLENIQEIFSESFESFIKIFENIEKDKERIKTEIQKIFTKIRNALNTREDELIAEIDNIFNLNYFDEELFRKGEKLPKQIKSSLEKGKTLDKEWNNSDLTSYINDCINIENNLDNINMIKESIDKCNKNTNIKLIFSPKDNQLENFIESIKSFGKIYYYNNNNIIKANLKEDIKENSISININELLVCNYPFQDDKNNHSTSNKLNPLFSFGYDKASLTEFNGLKCINTNGLLAINRELNLNRDWILFFEYCKKDWGPLDWSHIFSFGTHYLYGGKDESYYAITLETKPRDGYQIMKLTSKDAGDGK